MFKVRGTSRAADKGPFLKSSCSEAGNTGTEAFSGGGGTFRNIIYIAGVKQGTARLQVVVNTISGGEWFDFEL